MKNSSYADYAEQARAAFFEHLAIAENTLRIARIALDFKKYTRYQDKVRVETKVEQLGRSSITLQHIIYSNEDIGAIGNTVVVYMNDQNEPQHLSFDIRNKLEPYL